MSRDKYKYIVRFNEELSGLLRDKLIYSEIMPALDFILNYYTNNPRCRHIVLRYGDPDVWDRDRLILNVASDSILSPLYETDINFKIVRAYFNEIKPIWEKRYHGN